MHPKYILHFLLLGIVALYSPHIIAQDKTFGAALIGGVGFNNVAGLGVQGYNHRAVLGGIKLIAFPQRAQNFSVELNYTPRGFNDTNNQTRRGMQYVSLPLLYRFSEWYDQQASIYRFHLEVGPVAHRLFSDQNTIVAFPKDWDYSLRVGIRYMIQKQWGIEILYDHAFTAFDSVDSMVRERLYHRSFQLRTLWFIF